MAKRRMFSKEIVSSDAFRDMGLGSQALYYALGMEADDDGVVNNFRSVQRSIGANDDDMRILLAKRFVLPLGDDNSLIVIKHWKINNYIQKDRYSKTRYLKELSVFGLDRNGAYTEKENLCIQNGYTDKVSIDKVSIDKVSLDKNSKEDINKEREDDDELF